MTSYLIVTRVAIILWTNLAAMPATLAFDAIEAEWSAAASSYSGKSLRRWQTEDPARHGLQARSFMKSLCLLSHLENILE
jgi:hypothetical protein